MSDIRLRYTTLEIGNFDIHVRMLRDILQFRDNDGIAKKLGISSAAWPMFGVVWPAGEVLAKLMFDYHVDGKRVLEVGCGIALSSLVLSQRSADITATDHHPETEKFLVYNSELNGGRSIPFVRTGWADLTGNELGTFDLIIGADLLYESEHVDLLAKFINQHSRRHCDVIIVDPGRGFHAKFTTRMLSLGYSHIYEKLQNTNYLDKKFIGWIMTYSR